MSAFSEGWVGSQSILVILAHPDDPEFFLGATSARWTHAGHRVSYCLLTRGDKGANDPSIDPLELSIRREKEQRAATLSFNDAGNGDVTITLLGAMATAGLQHIAPREAQLAARCRNAP